MLIDREATLKKMCESCGNRCEKFEKAMRTTHLDFVTDKCGYYKFLAEQPAVEPEVRHGRWVHHNGGYSDHFECTACGEDIVLTGKWRFCPNCGADMREVSEDAGTD